MSLFINVIISMTTSVCSILSPFIHIQAVKSFNALQMHVMPSSCTAYICTTSKYLFLHKRHNIFKYGNKLCIQFSVHLCIYNVSRVFNALRNKEKLVLPGCITQGHSQFLPFHIIAMVISCDNRRFGSIILEA